MTTDELGSEYMDLVIEVLYKNGIICIPYTSKKKQLYAESLNGIEIKYDRRFRETKRLYFETHEKRKHDNKIWVESGILKNDNTYLFVIGDMKDIFIFSKKQLSIEYKKGIWNSIETGTSKGMVIDMMENGVLNSNFNFLCIKHIKIDGKEM